MSINMKSVYITQFVINCKENSMWNQIKIETKVVFNMT